MPKSGSARTMRRRAQESHRRKHPVHEVVETLPLAVDLIREEEHQRDLQEFGRLQGERADDDPSARGIDGGAKEHRDAQQEAYREPPVNDQRLPEVAMVDARHHERQGEPDDQRRELLGEIPVRVAEHARRLGRRRAVDHDAAQQRQREERGEEDLVGSEHAPCTTLSSTRGGSVLPAPRNCGTGRRRRTPGRGAPCLRAAPPPPPRPRPAPSSPLGGPRRLKGPARSSRPTARS